MQLFHCQKDLKVLECVQRSTGELGKGLECKSDEGAGGILSGDKERDDLAFYNCLKSGCSQVRVGLFSWVTG